MTADRRGRALGRRSLCAGLVAAAWASWPPTAPAQADAERREPRRRLVAAAYRQLGSAVRYDGAYRRIAYPGGDVPAEVGVCTDVVIRAYRAALGIDLQRLVHEDMRRSFVAYPKLWGLTAPDPNIDHRRVPNLATFLRRHGTVLATDAAAAEPGDLVTQLLPGNLPHIAIVADLRSPDGQRWQVIHNIGRGPRLEDALMLHRVTGCFRYPV